MVGVIYVTTDYFTKPETEIIVVRTRECIENCREQGRFAMLEEDIIPTEGWEKRLIAKAPISVCYNFSFGKCSGKTARSQSLHEASVGYSCQQIHVRQRVLDNLRKEYIFPVRVFKAKFVRALLCPRLKAELSFDPTSVRIKYLEVPHYCVAQTIGSEAFAFAYMTWLMDNANGNQLSTNTELCFEYSVGHWCALRSACPRIHALLEDTHCRDVGLKQSLIQIQSRYRANRNCGNEALVSFAKACNFSPLYDGRMFSSS